MPEASHTHNQPEYSVSEISNALKRTVEDTFSYVRVRGEISGFKRAASGHLYMDLKDDKAVLNGVCWRGNASKMNFKPEDGLEVVVTGKLSTYPGRSNYQIVIDSMEPAGEGALMALLEKRKKELAAEGLFDPARKKPLPFMPQKIAVVTSPTGAVIRDILHRIQDRFPTHVVVWPVRVQGEGAVEEIAAAIAGFDALNDKPDLLIVARGGGSIEDLWCFNEEMVVRAAAACSIPLISAVGHETDTTLIDFASDQRAPTPTAAAEMAVPVLAEWRLSVQDRGQRMQHLMLQRMNTAKERLDGLARGIPQPKQLLQYAAQRLDDWSERLLAALPLSVRNKQQQLDVLSARLTPQPILQRVVQSEQQLKHYRLNQLIEQRFERVQQRLQLQEKLLGSLNYENVLKRGFAMVQSPKGTLVTTQADAAKQASLSLRFHDGVIDVTPKAGAKPKPKKAAEPKEQSSLFE
ncbi:MAG: exodeoxyribonuclease VII large subunit [Rickettsiales bacterium]|nr:exodeoxyribonuclease VII large subunit [Rickettsiales bacterium]